MVDLFPRKYGTEPGSLMTPGSVIGLTTVLVIQSDFASLATSVAKSLAAVDNLT